MRRCIILVFSALFAFFLSAGQILSQSPDTPAQSQEQGEPAREPVQEQEQPDSEQLPPPRIPIEVQPQEGGTCVDCHSRITPGIVMDWQLSKHSRNEVSCPTCHGDQHNSMTDVSNARVALPEVCARCHQTQADQFARGKHALAWAAMKAMPTVHWQPMAQIEGMKGCGGCHRVGLKTEGEVRELIDRGAGFGASSCDVCHTRHLFSADEARSPQACMTCHMGMDHPQWEMYSSSKHGVRFLLKQSRMLPEETAAPTCQSCHLREGDHANRTAWGYFGVRLPMPEDAQWAKDRTVILQGMGVLDPSGNPTPRLEAIDAGDMARLENEDWINERSQMLKMCNDCHSINFARSELEKSDQMVREADKLMAEAIRTVAGLYRDGVLKKPDSYSFPFPDLLTFHDAPSVVELKLFQMFLEYRMRAFKGAFHANPDYAYWYGWSPMQRTLAEIKEKAEEMSAKKAQPPKAAGRPGPKR